MSDEQAFQKMDGAIEGMKTQVDLLSSGGDWYEQILKDCQSQIQASYKKGFEDGIEWVLLEIKERTKKYQA